MIAQVCELKPGEFIWVGGDTHIYTNHLNQVKEQISRREKIDDMPKMIINPEVKMIEDFQFEDFNLVGYNPLPAIKAPIAV